MKPLKEVQDKAKFYFTPPGFNCAQSVVQSISEVVFDIDSPYVARIATLFGGGMGKQDLICGAVTGAYMALGLIYGTDKPGDNRSKAYRLAGEFRQRFEKRFGSLYCTDLSKCNLSTREGWEKFRNEKVHEDKCPEFVNGAIEIVMEMLEEVRQ